AWILDQLDPNHAAKPAPLSDPGEAIARRELGHALGNTLANSSAAREQLFLLDHLEHRKTCGTGHRIAAIGPAESAGLNDIHDLGPASDGGERQAARQALRPPHHGRHDSAAVDIKHLSGSPRA